MVEVNKDIATKTLIWLEVLIDEPDLNDDDRKQIQSLINFWRLYSSFTGE